MATENDEVYIPDYILSEYEELAWERVRWRSLAADLGATRRRITARSLRIAASAAVLICLITGSIAVAVLTGNPMAVVVAVTLCSFAAVFVGMGSLHQYFVVQARRRHAEST